MLADIFLLQHQQIATGLVDDLDIQRAGELDQRQHVAWFHAKRAALDRLPVWSSLDGHDIRVPTPDVQRHAAQRDSV